MSSQSTHKETETSQSASMSGHFERNAYFHGKLMTARDMQVEQDYHRDRLHLLAQHVLGSGLVCGLETTVRIKGDTVQAKVSPGLAIDRQGRPIYVTGNDWVEAKYDGEADTPPACDDLDELCVFLTYRECGIESVPGGINACEEQCYWNRIVEEFGVTYTETEPTAWKSVPEDTIPSNADRKGAGLTPTQMAEVYYESHLGACAPHDEFKLLLGCYTENDGKWDRSDEPPRPMVYTNDMLYALITEHVRDLENPHEVLQSLNGVEGADGNVDLVSPEKTLAIVPPDVSEAKEGSVEVTIDIHDDILDRIKRCEAAEKKCEAAEKKCEELERKCDQLERTCDTLTETVDTLRTCLVEITSDKQFTEYFGEKCKGLDDSVEQETSQEQQQQRETGDDENANE